MEDKLRKLCTETLEKLASVFFAETLEDEAYMLDLLDRAKKLGIEVNY